MVSKKDNPNCPNYESHWQNAAERLYPNETLLGDKQTKAVDHEANKEYQHCEGH